MENTNDKIRISLDDLAAAETLPPPQPAAAEGGPRAYGNIQTAVSDFVAPEEKGSILLRGWFYLGLAGFLGALVGWAIGEPGFRDGAGASWGGLVMVPAVVTLMCIGLAVSESVVERSAKKALARGALSLPLGVILGFIFSIIAGVAFGILVQVGLSMGVQAEHIDRNPAFWVARGLAWMVFGAAGGIVYGIVGQSGKKTGYGVLGGMIGAGVGGMVFDPIAIAAHGISIAGHEAR